MCMQPPAKQQQNGFGSWKTLRDVNQQLRALKPTVSDINLPSKLFNKSINPKNISLGFLKPTTPLLLGFNVLFSLEGLQGQEEIKKYYARGREKR